MAYKRIQGIYKITNLINGLFYIGSALTILSRWANHKSRLKKNTHDNIYLQRAWNKYGEEVFKFEIVEEVIDVSRLIEREQYYLDTFQCFADLGKGYNILKEAGHTVGFKFSDETRALWSKQRTGRKHTEETKKLLSKLASQYKHSEESKKKISVANMGKHTMSEERKQHIRELRIAEDHPWKQIVAKYTDKQELIDLLNNESYRNLSTVWDVSVCTIVNLRKRLGIGPKKRGKKYISR